MQFRIALACFVATGLVTQTPAQTLPPAPPAQAASAEQALGNAQIDALVAPIALYPDTLLAQILMASTYPLEVIQAQRWVASSQLRGDELNSVAERQPWDASVKSLVAAPSVLEMMSTNLDWLEKLGDAVLAQQADVMDGIQRMRARAHENKKLSSGAQQTVTVRQDGGGQAIAIEPSVAGQLYVPYYDPAVVYGAWPYPETQPYYFGAPSSIGAGVLATGLAFGTAYALGRWTSGGNSWGGNINWNGGTINVDRDRATTWQHNPQHRHGVQYRNNAVQQRFGAGDIGAGGDRRLDFRGRAGEQVLQPRPGRPDQGGPNGGQRAGPGSGLEGRGSVGARPQKPAAQHRAGPGPRQPGRGGQVQAQRGRAGAAHARGGGRAVHAGGRGGGRAAHAGGRGGGGRGGGRKSDAALKEHIVLLGRLTNGVGLYRFAYKGVPTPYVGVIAQEVAVVLPQAVSRGRDGYLRVDYGMLGVRFQTLAHWRTSGGQVPPGRPPR